MRIIIHCASVSLWSALKNSQPSQYMQKEIRALNILLFVFLLPLGASNVLNAQQSDHEEAWQRTERYFLESLRQNNIVGGALLFLEHGNVTKSSFYGLAEISENRPVDKSTIFHWASNTKTLTAIAIMQLRDRGLISLNDPLTDYLPELRNVHNPYGSMDDLTIKMAMEHSTGFRNPTWPWGGGEEWHPFEPAEWQQLVAMFPYTELLFEPGTRHSYSNPAIIFLGKIIEIVTGDVYEAYIDKNILKPLGMHLSYFDNTPYHLLPQRSNSYTLHEGNPLPNGLDFNTGITVSNGGLNAPLQDMILYLGFLSGNEIKHKIIDRSSLEEMWTIQHRIGEEDGIRSSAGLSFFIEEFDGMRVIGHTGTQRSFYSFFYIHPESGTAVIGITNTDGRKGKPDMFQFREDLTRYIFFNLFSLYR